MRSAEDGLRFGTAGDRLATSRPASLPRVFWYAVLVICHLACFFAVNEINARRPASHLVELRLPVDDAIPYLGWTWTVYYGGDVYFILLAALVLGRLPETLFRRAVRAYLLMIVGGAVLQLAIPAQNLWPEILHPAHVWIRNGLNLKPFACLPSMHVALAVLPTLLCFSLFRSRAWKAAVGLAALLITASTVTLKQHVVLDAVTGIAWAFMAYLYWLRGARREGPERRSGP